MTLALFADDRNGAQFSPDRDYRYRLWRCWAPGPRVLWVMLNPSLADEVDLDPTLRRCRGFSRAWGFAGFEVVNLFALVSPYPEALSSHPDPVGPDNDVEILTAARAAEKVIVGWGACPRAKDRALQVLAILRRAERRPYCLGTTKDGHPRHPLYVPGATELQRFEVAG